MSEEIDNQHVVNFVDEFVQDPRSSQKGEELQLQNGQTKDEPSLPSRESEDKELEPLRKVARFILQQIVPANQKRKCVLPP